MRRHNYVLLLLFFVLNLNQKLLCNGSMHWEIIPFFCDFAEVPVGWRQPLVHPQPPRERPARRIRGVRSSPLNSFLESDAWLDFPAGIGHLGASQRSVSRDTDFVCYSFHHCMSKSRKRQTAAENFPRIADAAPYWWSCWIRIRNVVTTLYL